MNIRVRKDFLDNKYKYLKNGRNLVANRMKEKSINELYDFFACEIRRKTRKMKKN